MLKSVGGLRDFVGLIWLRVGFYCQTVVNTSVCIRVTETAGICVGRVSDNQLLKKKTAFHGCMKTASIAEECRLF